MKLALENVQYWIDRLGFLLAYLRKVIATWVCWLQDRKNLEEALTKLMQPTKWLVEHKALLPLLTQLKILSRTEANRKMIKEEAIAQLLRHISDRGVGTKIQGEGANVVLNICYEKENVKAVLACGGASTLVRT